MKELKINLKLYEYDELDDKAKERAFDDEYYFLLENPAEYEDDEGNMQYDDMEKWTSDDIKDYVEDCIRANEYLYYSNGEMAEITRYTGGHIKAGLVELKLAGQTFKL